MQDRSKPDGSELEPDETIGVVNELLSDCRTERHRLERDGFNRLEKAYGEASGGMMEHRIISI